MENLKNEPKDNKTEEEILKINLNMQRPKSFEIQSKNNDNNSSDYKRIRFYSEIIPSNFVPKLKPMKSEIKPTPMKLNHLNFKNNNFIINEITENNEKLVISFEEDSSDSNDTDNDFSDDEYEQLNFNVENENKINENLNFIKSLRKEMNLFKNQIKKQRMSFFNDYESLKNSILEIILEKENKIKFGGKYKIKKGFTILDVLSQKLSFDEEFIL